MYCYEIRNKITGEFSMVYGYDWEDAVERIHRRGREFNAAEWVIVMVDYED